MHATSNAPGAFSRASAAALSALVLFVLCAAASAAGEEANDHRVSGASSAAERTIDAALAARLLALDPEHISATEVRDVLALAPAPRIILLEGSFAPVSMQPFGEFLVAMGYPESSLRHPGDGSWSMSSFGSGAALAGSLAWYYERERMMPMLIGHSQGGMLVLRTLHELAGEFAESVPVWDPVAGSAQPRSTIVDPQTGTERPVKGLRVPYATALATGRLMRVLLGQWTMLPLLRKVPDTVADFTGFLIEWDAIAGTFPGAERYRATGTAHVRNVTLPASYLHVDLPRTQHLAADPVLRAWIDAYRPGTDLASAPGGGGIDSTNLLHAADIWYSVKKHWCLAAQSLLRAAPAR